MTRGKNRLAVLVALSTCMLLGVATSAMAQADEHCRRGAINCRQENQQDRIAQGINHGSLTAAEAARLEQQEARINRQEARFRLSGDGLSPRERLQIDRELNRESRNI